MRVKSSHSDEDQMGLKGLKVKKFVRYRMEWWIDKGKFLLGPSCMFLCMQSTFKCMLFRGGSNALKKTGENQSV